MMSTSGTGDNSSLHAGWQKKNISSTTYIHTKKLKIHSDIFFEFSYYSEPFFAIKLYVLITQVFYYFSVLLISL